MWKKRSRKMESDLGKTVVNLSNRLLTTAKDVLSLGLNYAVPPKNLPVAQSQ